jgi:hypothetical protein
MFVFWAALAVLLVGDLYLYLVGRETVSQWLHRLGLAWPWLPWLVALLFAALWLHFFGP